MLTPEEREAVKYEELVAVTQSRDFHQAQCERLEMKLDIYKDVYREIFDTLLSRLGET